MKGDATFSRNMIYRYTLSRDLYPPDQIILNRVVTFICLNPSTATATENDPTVRRCINFAIEWGGSKLYVLNIFAFRGTIPKVLYQVKDPVGPDNDDYIKRVTDKSDIVVAAWGNHGDYRGRGAAVREMLVGPVCCLGVTHSGQPKHPLYLRADTPLQPLGSLR